MKFIQRDITGVQEILRTRDFEAIAVMVDDVDIPLVEGKKVVKAGTVVGGKTLPVLENNKEVVVKKEDGSAEGVLLYDVDVTHGPRNASMVIRGNIDLNKIEEPNELAVAAIGSRILFIK